MTDPTTTEWPPAVAADLDRVRELAGAIDHHSAALEPLYTERIELFLRLRAGDPPVPYSVIGRFSGVKETAVRVAINKEKERRERAAAAAAGGAGPPPSGPRRAPRR